MKQEQNIRLSFSDVPLNRESDGTITRSIHRKGTWSGQSLHFSSFRPIAYKRGLIRTLFHRARMICSESTLADKENFLFHILKMNGYP